MKVINGIDGLRIETPAAVTIGKFDGMHLGHRKLFSRVAAQKALGLTAVVFSLDMGRFLHEKPLTPFEEKKEILESMGVDILVNCSFTDQIREMSAERFEQEIMKERLNAAYVALGGDFHYGFRRSGDSETLAAAARRMGMTAEILEKEKYRGEEISSSAMRAALLRGDMETFTGMKGSPFSVNEIVVHGRHLGKSIGFPTINQPADESCELPPRGVYATRVEFDGRRLRGLTNLGVKPTVGEGNRAGFETTIEGIDENLYGKRIRVSLIAFVRGERKFDSLEELTAQIKRDRQAAAKIGVM